MCSKDKCCCPKKKRVAGKKRRAKVGKDRLNASQILVMGRASSLPLANPAVPLLTNNALGEEQLMKAPVKEKELVINSAPAKQIYIPIKPEPTEPKLISVPIVQNAIPIRRAKPEPLAVPRPRQITQNVPSANLAVPEINTDVSQVPARKGIKEIMNRNIIVPKTIAAETIKYTSEPVQQVAINKGAIKPERKMKSMVAEALAPPVFKSVEAAPQTIALPSREPIATSLEFAPPVGQQVQSLKSPMYTETNRTIQPPNVKPAPKVEELRPTNKLSKPSSLANINSTEDLYNVIQQRGGAREGAGRPTFQSLMMRGLM